MTDYMADKGLRIFRNGWEIIPIIPGKKSPGIPQWASREITETLVQGWAANGFGGYGIGIRTGEVIMLDVDVPDKALADEVHALIAERLGEPLVRFGQRPKRGLIYRTDVPFAKLQTNEFRDGADRRNQTEALGKGQQFVSNADHPATGLPYEWEGFSPEDVFVWELTTVTEAQVRSVLAEIEALYRAKGLTARISTRAETGNLNKFSFEDLEAGAPLTDLTVEKLRLLVEQIPNDDVPYEDNSHNQLGWLQLLMGTAHQTGKSDEGEEIARAWSEKSGKHEDEQFDKTWRSLEKLQEGRRSVTARYIVKWAKFYEEKEAKRPEILIKAGYMSEIANEAEDALLAYDAPIYGRGSQLVRPVVEEVDASDDRKTKVARLTQVGPWGLMDWMSRAAIWKRFDNRAKKPVRTDPPTAIAQTILSRDGEWRLRPLSGVITTPTIRPDGSLILKLGYDSSTRLLLVQPPAMPPIPDVPTRRDALRALRLLQGLLHEFPFVNEESRSVALSMLMTPVLRGAIPNAPLHVARAPVAGTGKSYLVDVSSTICTGRTCPVIAAGQSVEETEKRLGSILLAGQPIASIDNLNGELEGDLLCQVIERPRVQVRILGKSETPTIESRVTLFATGNNLIVKGDMVRRSIVAELDTNLEQPELRVFADNPVNRVLGDRGAYVAAVLTIAKAFLAIGCPDQGLDPLASFDAWSRLVRSSLVWLGCADPKVTQDKIRDEDPEIQALQRVVRSWRNAIGVGPDSAATAGDLIRTAEAGENDAMAAFHAALSAIGSPRGVGTQNVVGSISVIAVGRWLAQRKGRVVGGLKIEAVKDRKNDVFNWFLSDISALRGD